MFEEFFGGVLTVVGSLVCLCMPAAFIVGLILTITSKTPDPPRDYGAYGDHLEKMRKEEEDREYWRQRGVR